MEDEGDNLFSGEAVRERTVNWLFLVKEVEDGYNKYHATSHGVQKDAIQNGWDARIHAKTGKDWSFAFELIENDGKRYFIMTDSGTMGLTGKVLANKEMTSDLDENERWARFESMAFTKTSSGSLGSRGRGKMIFFAASKKKMLYYDTLTQDGNYRFGVAQMKENSSPIYAWDEDAGRKKIAELTKGVIKPIDKQGARIIIVEPVDELTGVVKAGEFSKYISETWWEIIKKFGVSIKVTCAGRTYKVKYPEEMDLPEKDSETVKVVKIENTPIPGVPVKIKHLHICYLEKPVPESLRGISVQRGGMRIMNLELLRLPPEIREKIIGFVELDEDGEACLREAEGLEHYDFGFRKPVPREMKRYLEDALDDFAKKKLGYGKSRIEVRREQQRKAEMKARDILNKFAGEQGFFGGSSERKTKKKKKKEFEWKKIRISMNEVEYPREGDLRVNYGEKVTGLGKVVNQTLEKICIRCRVFLRYGRDREVKVYRDIICDLKPDEDATIFESQLEQIFSQEKFSEKGRYILVWRIMNTDKELDIGGKRYKKGEIIDEKRNTIYLEQDPPKGGLFEGFEPEEFPEEIECWMSRSVKGEGNGYMVRYNTGHQAWRSIEDGEESEITKYLTQLGVFEMCSLDLEDDEPKMFEEEEAGNSAEAVKKAYHLLGELMNRYFEGED